MEEQIEGLVAQMTLEEKVSLVSGTDFWTTPPVKRLNIPQFKVSDGPNGARGGDFSGGMSSACFPVGIALAATWNPDLIEAIGVALAEETKTKGAYVLLGPTVNIHRSPLNGRNFECYSEDPYLSARIAVGYIKGLQSQNISACVKHFVCNDSEYQRNSISSEVGERALREIYLPPFYAAIKEADSWSIMTAYNRLNGTFCAENSYILQDILKGEWGFAGFVVSDWFGAKSTVPSANYGLDLEMPGPPAWWGQKLIEAVQNGEVKETTIDDKVHRILRIMARTGALDTPELKEEASIDRPEHRQVIRKAAAEGIVLLKNEGDVLPIDKQINTIAIIGPNAKDAKVMGGGSAKVAAHYVISPFEGVRARAGDDFELRYELGCASFKMLPLLPLEAEGFAISYYNNREFAGEPVVQEQFPRAERMWMDSLPAAVDPASFSARLETTFVAKENGRHTFSVISAGYSRLYVEDQLAVDNWDDWRSGDAFFGSGSVEKKVEVELKTGQSCKLRLDFARRASSLGISAVRVGYLPPVPADMLQQAAQVAAEADVAVVFVGLGGEWESEGFDRPNMELPAEQVELVHAVAAANPKTVVVLNTGSPITMPWLNEVAAVVQAWYPGQECGNAIADVLFGDVNPSGRLPQTFPMRLQDNPAYINYPGENGRVHYGEGIFVGYRYYDKKEIPVLFPFGYGLSYTSFAYNNLRLSAAKTADAELQVSVDVTNIGSRTGKEVVQLYVSDVKASVARPPKELKGFQKVELEPGETETVTFTLDHASLAFYDDGKHGWRAEAGEYVVGIGRSSAEIELNQSFVLTADHFVAVKTQPKAKLTLNSLLQELLADDGAKAVLAKHVPDMIDSPQLEMGMGMSLQQIASFAPGVFTEALLAKIAEDLAAL